MELEPKGIRTLLCKNDIFKKKIKNSKNAPKHAGQVHNKSIACTREIARYKIFNNKLFFQVPTGSIVLIF